jgi:hypothetical protein
VKIGVRFTGSESPKPSLVRHVFRGHGPEGVAALHNYLASIFTAPSGAATSDSTECAGQRRSGRSPARTMSGVLGPALAPASALRGPAGARRATPTGHADQDGSHVPQTGGARSRLPRLRLFSSQAPRLNFQLRPLQALSTKRQYQCHQSNHKPQYREHRSCAPLRR